MPSYGLGPYALGPRQLAYATPIVAMQHKCCIATTLHLLDFAEPGRFGRGRAGEDLAGPLSSSAAFELIRTSCKSPLISASWDSIACSGRTGEDLAVPLSSSTAFELIRAS